MASWTVTVPCPTCPNDLQPHLKTPEGHIRGTKERVCFGRKESIFCSRHRLWIPRINRWNHLLLPRISKISGVRSTGTGKTHDRNVAVGVLC